MFITIIIFVFFYQRYLETLRKYKKLSVEANIHSGMLTSSAPSICFEIWGGRGPGSKIFDFLGKFLKNVDSFRQFHKQKINFSGQISEKFRVFFR